MKPTDKDIVNSPTFPIALTLLQCAKCNYISSDRGLTKHEEKCPNCDDNKSSRGIYPSLSAIKLIEMVGYFYKDAIDRKDEAEEGLIQRVYKATNNKYEKNTLLKLTKDLKSMYNALRSGDKSFEDMCKKIEDTLLLTDATAKAVFPILIGNPDTYEEHKAMVILACTFMDEMYGSLITELSRTKNPEIKIRNGKTGDIKDKDKKFKQITGVTFVEALQEIGEEDFHYIWDKVRKERNSFIHKSPYAISRETAEQSFDLIKRAIGVFSQLINVYGIKKAAATA